MSENEGHSIFRVIPLIFQFFLPFVALLLLWISPSVNVKMVTIYTAFYILSVVAVIFDYFLTKSKFVGSSVVDTITLEKNQNKFILQQFMPLKYVVFISIAIGLMWGGFYFIEVTGSGRPMLAVPNLFISSPVPLEGFIDSKAYDAFQTSFTVGAIEEQLFTGVVFSSIWGIISFLVSFIMKFKRKSMALSFVIMMFSAVIGGATTSYVFHNFAYGANQPAYETAFFHFTTANVIAGITGTTIAPTIAHIIHNWVVKTYLKLQAFQTEWQPF